MSDKVSYKLIDEVADLTILDDFDPLLKSPFEEYIHISEKKNLGLKDRFNTMTNIETVDVHVAGLLLNWGNDVKSPLRAVSDNRFNIENLYMYADTILIDSYLHLPQTNVFIYARRLIIGEDGILDTTPKPFDIPYAEGGNEENGMLKGADGDDAGNIKIYADDVIFKERKPEKMKLSKKKIKHCDPHTTRKNELLVKPNFEKDFCMLKGEFEIDWDENQKGPVKIVFPDRIPTNGEVDLNKTANLKIEINDKKQLKSSSKIKIELWANGNLVITGIDQKNYKIYGPKLKADKRKYIGIYINKDENKSIPIKGITYSKIEPYFILNGSDGQHGQKGVYKERLTDDENVPIKWGEFQKAVFEHDQYIGDDKSWEFMYADEKEFNDGKIYYTNSIAFNNTFGEKDKKIKNFKLGNEEIENLNNGLDAYSSGNGGNGGNGGNLSLPKKIKPPTILDLSGGMNGCSELSLGEKLDEDSKGEDKTVYHKNYLIVHKDIGTDDFINKYKSLPKETAYNMIKEVAKTFNQKIDVEFGAAKVMKSRDGKDAEGKDGKAGGKGEVKKLEGEDHLWLHPFVLESVIQFSKDTFLAGDRRPALWLLSKYEASIKKLNYEPEDFLTKNLTNEISAINNKIKKNLDYFGNPVGWIPRLSAISNIGILKRSKPAIVQVLYYASKLNFEDEKSKNQEEQLQFIVEQLKKEIEDSREDLIAAYDKLNDVKAELDKNNKEVDEWMFKIRDLQIRIENEEAVKARDQALFTGILKIAAGICQACPVGQPYLGAAGGILDKIGDIDITSDNPFGEAVKTTGNVASELGSFIKDNKKKITKDVNSKFKQQIEEAESSISVLDDDIEEYQGYQEEAEEALKEAFGNDLYNLQHHLKNLESVKSREELEFYNSDDYVEIFDNLNAINAEIKKIEGMDTGFGPIIKNLEEEKSGLIKDINEYKKKKKKRAKNVKKAGEILENIGKGLSTASDGITTLMTPIDKQSEEFKNKLEKVANEKYKKEFTELYENLEIFSAEKLKTSQKLLKLENIIESSCQTISGNLIKISEFNDQRAAQQGRQLNLLTKQFLKRVMRDTRELLLVEIYYLVRSYQYKFVKKIETNLFDTQTIFKDINNFYTNNGIESPSKKDFKDAFNFVLQSKFISLVLELLTTKIQALPADSGKPYYLVTITKKAKTSNGLPFLKELNKKKSVKFKLHELGKDSKGTGKESYYRIKDIEFTDIKVSFPESVLKEEPKIKDRISFRFGIRHSGESIIRDEYGDYYYFTSKGPEDDKKIIQNIISWNAGYNGKERKNKKNGINKLKPSSSSFQAVSKLLGGIDDKDKKLEYSEHLPGATSELTLSIFENNANVDFEITELAFKFYYEMKTN